VNLGANINLDPLENLLGQDIDLNLGSIVNTAPITGALNDVLGGLGTGLGTGGSTGLNITTGPTVDHSPTDTDLVVNGALGIPGLGTTGLNANVNLDPVENLLGQDIDINLGAALNASNLTGNLTPAITNLTAPLGEALALSPARSAMWRTACWARSAA
jgi:hypothetical protein